MSSPNCVGADANYDNRAYWKFVPQGNGKYFIENLKTERYLFQNGNKIKGDRGAEGGWTSNPGFGVPLCVGSDANYFDRAYWKLEPQGEDRYFIVNVQTQRYLLQDGSKIEGNRGEVIFVFSITIQNVLNPVIFNFVSISFLSYSNTSSLSNSPDKIPI